MRFESDIFFNCVRKKRLGGRFSVDVCVNSTNTQIRTFQKPEADFCLAICRFYEFVDVVIGDWTPQFGVT